MDIRGEPRLDAFTGQIPTTAPVQGAYATSVKPVLDRLLGSLLLIFASPIIAVVALVVLFKLGRPVFYSHVRIGHKGVPFRLYKFRTMLPDRRQAQNGFKGEDRRANHKSPHDPRHTTAGRVLRARRLDELPQLWNVVKGEMSLVGPRPEVPSEVGKYEDWQHRRHLVKPGLTGLWQISEHNGEPMREHTELDLEYLERIGFVEDLRILAKTPLAMLGRRSGR